MMMLKKFWKYAKGSHSLLLFLSSLRSLFFLSSKQLTLVHRRLNMPGNDQKVLIKKGKLIKELRLLSKRQPPFRLNIIPFILLYILSIGLDFYCFGWDGYIHFILPPLVILHCLSFISVFWSADIASFINYKSASLEDAEFVKVSPTGSHRGSKSIEELVRSAEETYFIYQKRKYVLDESKGLFCKVVYPVSYDYSDYLKSAGWQTVDQVAESKRKFGRNVFDIPMPTFWDLYKEQALAPFFVFQVFCVALWCLDDYFWYSLFILMLLLVFEGTTAKSRLNNVQIFRSMQIPESQLLVYRCKQWTSMSSNELLPGDLVIIRRQEQEQLVPCDLLLLSGSCITNESMLTGESTPQMKEALITRSSHDLKTKQLDMSKDKIHIIFGGTSVLQHTNPQHSQSNSPSSNGTHSDSSNDLSISLPSHPSLDPLDLNESRIATAASSSSSDQEFSFPVPLQIKNGCLCYVLRTGFNTGQGKLVRTILFSSERVTENNRESFMFIFILLFFALAASGYVLYEGLQDALRSRWKLMLECTLIITSVVPPELPMQLSLAVNSSLINLIKEGVFCTEPFRIPYAGKVGYCAFDKTGTLTQEHLNMKGVILITKDLIDSLNPSKKSGTSHKEAVEDEASSEPTQSNASCTTSSSDLESVKYTHPDMLPVESSWVMAGCHSLSVLNKDTIGDPIELASMKHVGWNLLSSDTAQSKKMKMVVKIKHRFHFNSTLKRMCTIVSIDQVAKDAQLVALVKGAPEIISEFLNDVPEDYDHVYKTFARRGARIIAMAYKTLDPSSIASSLTESPGTTNNHHSINVNNISNDILKSLKRETCESNLIFAGFLVFECPLKPDSQEVIQLLNESSHQTVMITGDAALTACEVAKQLGIAKKKTLILESKYPLSTDGNISSMSNGSTDGSSHSTSKETNRLEVSNTSYISSKFLNWISVDESENFPFAVGEISRLSLRYDFCIAGHALDYVLKDTLFCEKMLQHVRIFARASPEDKTLILAHAKKNGMVTLMCGDGTNDVGALKQAHVGVALLMNPKDERFAKLGAAQQMASRGVSGLRNGLKSTPSEPVPPSNNGNNSSSMTKTSSKKFSNKSSASTLHAANTLKNQKDPPKSIKEALQQAQQALADADSDQSQPIVQLGDASIASPFTSKGSSLLPILSILRQGRCTLVTTMQMFKILALNSLIYAFSLSVLYLDGIRYGDTQATVMAMLTAVCFLFISRAQPLQKLSKERPVPTIFNPYMVVSVIGQFAIHLVSLILVVRSANEHMGPDYKKPKPDSTFEPNLLNSAVFLISASQQLSTFMVNYIGHPFMQSIRENRGFFFCIMATAAIAIISVLQIIPDFNTNFDLVLLPDDFKATMISIMACDFLGAWTWEILCKAVLKRS